MGKGPKLREPKVFLGPIGSNQAVATYASVLVTTMYYDETVPVVNSTDVERGTGKRV